MPVGGRRRLGAVSGHQFFVKVVLQLKKASKDGVVQQLDELAQFVVHLQAITSSQLALHLLQNNQRSSGLYTQQQQQQYFNLTDNTIKSLSWLYNRPKCRTLIRRHHNWSTIAMNSSVLNHPTSTAKPIPS